MNSKKIRRVGILLSVAWLSHQADTHAIEMHFDSLGIEKRGEKIYVLHKVEPKQTLFSILKKYGSSLTEYRNENLGAPDGVNVGQVIRVLYRRPLAATLSKSTTVQPAPPRPSAENGFHVVGTKEGLYGVAIRYGVTMAQIRRWNNLTSDVLSVGQVLVVSQAAADRSQGTQGVSTPTPSSDPSLPMPTPGPTTTPSPPRPTEPKPADPDPAPAHPSTPNLKTVNEKGIAEAIEVEDQTSKYLALHRTAPIGTMIAVKNETNGQTVYVKVIGHLPESAVSERVVIRLSPKAFERLRSSDMRRARVELSYVAQ
jgi:LysM repeat protein